MIAPNSFSGPGSVPFVTPTYPSMQPYLQELAAASNGTASIAKLGLIAPGADPTDSPAQGYIYATGGENYNYDLHYDMGTTVSVTSGTYTVTMSGTVTANLTAGQTPNEQNPATITYTGLSITITLDSEDAVNTWIYQQANPALDGTQSAGDSHHLCRRDLSKPAAVGPSSARTSVRPRENFYLRIPNDFTQGMLAGMVGSDVPNGIDGGTIGELNSAQWWENPQLAFAIAQPDNPYYNVFSEYLWYNSGGVNPGDETFTDGGIYTNPFDDRWGTADLNMYGTGQPQDATLAMKVTLIPDGDLDVNAVPEPGTWGMIIGGLVLLLGRHMVKRRRTA